MDPGGDILLALGRLEGKVDSLITQMQRTQTDIDDLDVRVRTLEGSKALLVGVCTVLATLASYTVSIFT